MSVYLCKAHNLPKIYTGIHAPTKPCSQLTQSDAKSQDMNSLRAERQNFKDSWAWGRWEFTALKGFVVCGLGFRVLGV